MTTTTCPMCGTPVRVQGKTTLYYVPLCDEEIAAVNGTNAGLTDLILKKDTHIAFLMDIIKRAKDSIDKTPCHCHEGYKMRNLTDPSCPRCNWYCDETIDILSEAEGGKK